MFNRRYKIENALLKEEIKALEKKLANAEEMIRTLNNGYARREEELLSEIQKLKNNSNN